MKKLTFALALFTTSFAALAATNEYDMIKGIDLTSQTNITTSQLNQLVDRARTATNKGMTIVSNAAPDVANNARYTNFIWIDTSFQPPRLRVYTTSSNVWNEPGFTNITVADDSITSAKIVNGTIQGVDIAAGTLTSDKLATGIITSNYLAAANITSDKFAANSVLAASIGPSAISSSNQIGLAAIVGTNIATNTITSSNLALGLITSNYVGSNTIVGANIATNTVGGTNIVVGGITGTNVASNTISKTNLMADTLNFIPVLMAVCDGGTTVLRQTGSQGISSITTGGTGFYKIAVSNAFSDTNFFVAVTPVTAIATPLSSSIVSNGTSGFTLMFKEHNGTGTAPLQYSIIIHNY